MIRIALAGNPNSGKTTLFNELTGGNQYVGNWPGVTVEKKEGRLKSDKSVIIQDLPGIYSLSPYTLEEVVSRKYLLEERPDVIINIVDASNLERNLYLTTQLIEIGIPVLIALNMIDIVQKRGNIIDTKKISGMFCCPVATLSALKGTGAKEVADMAIHLAREGVPPSPCRFSGAVEAALAQIEHISKQDRWHTIKIFERDREMDNPSHKTEEIIHESEISLSDDSESIIINERYKLIDEIVKNFATISNHDSGSAKIDNIVTNKYLAFPIFALVMFFVYYISISTIGNFLTSWINDTLFGQVIPDLMDRVWSSVTVGEWLQSLVMGGIISGVGTVVSFLPQLIVLFLFLAILEDCGYMSRVAFIMDRLFRKFGLSGKSFIPMIISTGCAVPGIMSTRTIESENDRRMTMLTTSFIPCSAKLPIIALIAGALFGGTFWVAPSAYFLGIAATIITGLMLKKTAVFSGNSSPFVMELPAYHIPSVKVVLRTVYDRSLDFIKKAVTMVMLATIIVWFLSSCNIRFQMVDANESILAWIGRLIAPIFQPLGWGNWQTAVASITGILAKENIVGTLGVLYEGTPLNSVLTPLSAYSFLAFNLLCAPCIAAMSALRAEMKSRSLTFFSIAYQCTFAYIVSLIIYQFGLLLGGIFTLDSVTAILAVVIFLFFILRKDASARSSISRKTS